MAENVLIVEDDDMCALLVESQLRRYTDDAYQITRVATLRDALAQVHNERVDLILLDLGLPDSSGLHSVSRMKEAAPDIPIVVLTANEDENLPLESVKHGAQEYLSKDHVVGKLLIRAVNLSVARQKQLARAQAEALLDPLTGLCNRRGFDLELRRLQANAQRISEPYCVAMIDIDHFKRINDTWGHEVGDLAINQVAGVLQSLGRSADTVSRYGGEEFGLAFPGTRLETALAILERMRTAIAVSECQAGRQRFTVTVSVGVAECRAAEADNVLAEADQALYRAKAEGRNCIRSASGALCAG